jgi:hypothetical protein
MSLSPLTSQTAPVMKDEWSEARKWTTSAISSGAAEPADWDLGRDLAEDLLGDVLEHLGRDEAGGDGVDGEAHGVVVEALGPGELEARFTREGLRQPEQAGLRRRVVGRPMFPVSPMIEEMLMMRPDPRSTMWGRTAWDMKKARLRLTARTLRRRLRAEPDPPDGVMLIDVPS